MSVLTDPLTILLFLVLFSLIAPMAYLSWVRKTERYNTEAWGPLISAFLYGAFVGTFTALILELIFSEAYGAAIQPDLGLPNNANLSLLILAVVAAPFIEEGMKGLGVYRMRTGIRFVADGLVFGAAVGFGFSFVENVLYGLSGWVTGGLVLGIATIIVRSFSSSLLHGSSAAMTGQGVADNQLRKGQGHAMAGYYLLAVAMHATFNLLASIVILLPFIGYGNLPSSTVDDLSILSLLAVIVFAFAVFGHVRERISETQFQSINPPVTPPYRSPGP